MREGILNIDMEVVNKHNLNLNHITLLEYLIDHADNIKGISVTSLAAILYDLPAVFQVKRTLTNYIDHLVKEGIIVEHNDNLLKCEYISERRHEDIKMAYSGLRCEWCNADVLVTERHHYPVREADGGKEVVEICPNCHREFHSIRLFEVKAPFMEGTKKILNVQEWI